MTEKKQTKDISSKTILHNSELCCQFIKDNINIPILKNIRPEDIEDCTELFRSYFGVEYESDVIKRIRVRVENTEKDNKTSFKEQKFEFYVVSLIEHKSKVDYNVVVQLLKYMTCIWAEYEKTFGTDYKDKVKTKAFQYPPILPIVYYEGTQTWTAALHLKDRIFMNEIFEEYIPDFSYVLVNLNDISKEELLGRKDEMSLIMLVNKIQNAAELSDFLDLPEKQVTSMMSEAPEAVVDIIVMYIQVLCTKLNLSKEETEKCVKKVRSKSMGYFWENMEKIDVQEGQRARAEGMRLQAEAAETIAKAKIIQAEAAEMQEEGKRLQAEAAELRMQAEEDKRQAEEDKRQAEENKRQAEELKAEAEEKIQQTEHLKQECAHMRELLRIHGITI